MSPENQTVSVPPTTRLIFRYDPNHESYTATTVPTNKTQPTNSYGYAPQRAATPEALLSQLAQDGHRPSSQQLESLADLQTNVRCTYGEHTIVAMTAPSTGNRNLLLVTPKQRAVQIWPSHTFSPNGYNWGYKGSGPNETAHQIANTVLGHDHAGHADLSGRLRSALADIKTNDFSINVSNAAKPDRPLDIKQGTSLSPNAAQSITKVITPTHATRTPPRIGL